jgi:hypothetical protein
MPTMPKDLSKPNILKNLDGVLGNPARRTALAQDLKAIPPTSLVALAIKYGIVAAGSAEEVHLKNDWFGPNWWSTADSHGPGMTPDNKEELVRGALIVACEDATKQNKPVDTYWLCRPRGYGSGNALLDASVSWSSKQVTLLLITPMPPNQPPPTWGDPIRYIEMDAAGQTISTNCVDGSTTVIIP